MDYFTKHKWWPVALIALFVANIITLVFFWVVKAVPGVAPVASPAKVQGRPESFLVKQLDFSPDQEQRYDKLFMQHQQQVRAIRDSIRVSKDDFFALIDNNNVTDEQLNTAAARSTKFQQQLDILTFKHFKEVKALCTPQQQKDFDEVIQTVVRRMAPPPRPAEPGRPPKPGREGEPPRPHRMHSSEPLPDDPPPPPPPPSE